ncbi:hypothetical protein C6P45_000094 [Maudiozyma exigua]|uniref:Uncharacterized protein n=1 Tax=Maudiozyma exigua TaxID=34358 RepID=A0A9P6WEX3_MAUEX|nr:hypothetical protein C6P45_000094 [Kazachstania exigua]
MTTPFTNFCIYCDQLISTNENVLYYTRPITEIEKFQKQLYCSEKCKYNDKCSKLTTYTQFENSDSFSNLNDKVHISEESVASDYTQSHRSSRNENMVFHNTIDHENSSSSTFESILFSPLLISANISHISEQEMLPKNAMPLQNNILHELQSAYRNVYPDNSPKMTNFLNDIYCSSKTQSEHIAEKNYTLWLNAIHPST